MRVISTLFAVVLLVAACDLRRELPNHSPLEADPRTAAEVTDDDVAVFEAVIAAYAASGKVLGHGSPAPGLPPVSAEPAVRPLTADYVTRYSFGSGLEMLARTRRCGQVPLTGWWDFSDSRLEQVTLPTTAAAGFDRRNAHAVALDRFQPKYLYVRRTNRIGHGPAVVFTLPGYSEKRDVAVVEVTGVAPAPFGSGSAFVFLRRGSAGWQAIARHTGCVT